MARRGSIITLTTDFSTADGYVGAVKGVILSRQPDACIVDITHDIPAGDLRAVAWCARVACRSFATGTIHLVVVDPGVGSARRGVILASDGQLYVGPDNGSLSLVRSCGQQAWVIDAARIDTRAQVSRTFHARDVFAPVAAALASGLSPGELGDAVDPDSLVMLPIDLGFSQSHDEAVGRIVHVDRFGNCVTSLPEALALRGSDAGGTASGAPVLAPVASYSEIPADRAAFIAGSQGFIEISVKDASASSLLGLGIGDEVCIGLVREET